MFAINKKNIATIKTTMVYKFILRCLITFAMIKIVLLKSSLHLETLSNYVFIDCRCTIETIQIKR